MNPSFRSRLLPCVLVAAATSLAAAQTPSTGVDLGTLTPKTPSQKAADASAANAQSNQKPGTVPGVPGSSNTATAGQTSAAQGGIGSNIKGTLSKTGIGVVGAAGSNAKSTPAAADDTTSSSTDVQVKMPSNFKK